MDKEVKLPKYFWDGIKPLKNHFPANINLIVFDTETEDGIPYLLTFYDGLKPTYIRVTQETVLDEFMNYLFQRCSKNKTNLLFAHNLPFDLTAVLCEYERELFQYLKPPLLEHELGVIEIFAQKTWFAQIHFQNKASLKVIDTGNFIRGSLYELSRKLNLPHKKPKRPESVKEGKKPRTGEEWRRLIDYCREEILSTYDLAQFILDMHRRYDTAVSVSASHFASKVFKKHFLKTKIPQVPSWVRWLAEQSIHGGRASTFVDGIAVIPDVNYYDYNSFYPWAMANLPPLTDGEWLRVNGFVDEYEGFYQIDGYVHKCRYPVILKNAGNFEFANDEYVRCAPVASYELREALRCGEIDITKIKGYIWVPSKNAENPFRDYVEEFYKLKQSTPKDNPKYMTYKLLLNSLYGKTYQALRQTDYEEEPELVWNSRLDRAVKNRILYRAGGIYLPHVGSWITSMCRAKLHESLHRYEAIDCATDSFKTKRNDVPTGSGLGELKHEHHGLLLLIRPKLYVMFSPKIQKEVMNDYGGDLRAWLKDNLGWLEEEAKAGRLNEHIPKYALHGFWGNAIDLLRLYRDRSNEYIAKHMTKIREAIRQRKQARVMETRPRRLAVDWENEIMPCGLTMSQALKEKELCVAPRSATGVHMPKNFRGEQMTSNLSKSHQIRPNTSVSLQMVSNCIKKRKITWKNAKKR